MGFGGGILDKAYEKILEERKTKQRSLTTEKVKSKSLLDRTKIIGHKKDLVKKILMYLPRDFITPNIGLTAKLSPDVDNFLTLYPTNPKENIGILAMPLKYLGKKGFITQYYGFREYAIYGDIKGFSIKIYRKNYTD